MNKPDITIMKSEKFHFFKNNFGSCLSWAVTFAWLIFIFFKIKDGELPTELNEFGDFIAGAFAPLAFFWLVRGYYQQGTELQAQATELKNSVKQQQRLAEIYEEEMNQRDFQVKPNLIFKCRDIRLDESEYFDEDELSNDIIVIREVQFYLDITNNGDSARNLLLKNIEGEPYKKNERYELKQGETESILFRIEYQECESLLKGGEVHRELQLTFYNIYGKIFNKSLSCQISCHKYHEDDRSYFSSNTDVSDKMN